MDFFLLLSIAWLAVTVVVLVLCIGAVVETERAYRRIAVSSDRDRFAEPSS